MTRNPRPPRLAALLFVLAVLATACRGGNESAGGDESAADGAGSAAATAAQTSAAPEPPSDAEESEETEASEETGSEDTASEEPSSEADSASPSASDGGSAAGDVTFDVGVTEEACPDAVNPDNGCIFLGTLSDLTVGPFAPLAVPITEAQEAFWAGVNDGGGIGGFDVNVTEYVRDNEYNPEVHAQQYQEIRGDVLALAQTLGSPTTAAIIEDLRSSEIVAAPASWTSLWAFEDVILESGVNYCAEAMNNVDYAVANLDGIESVMAVGYPGDYGQDGGAGAGIAAEANGLTFTNVETPPGPDNQGGAVSQILSAQPTLVVVTTNPTDMATIVGQSAAQGFQGQFMVIGPGWNKAVLDSAAGQAIQAQVLVSGPWLPFDSDTPGHQAMRDALGEVDANEGYTSGWAWSYPLLAALEAAAESGDLTRAGLLEAVSSLESVDYEGMLPEGSGNYAGEPNDVVVRESTVTQPDPAGAVGLTVLQELEAGPTATDYEFTEPCFTTTG